MLFLLGHIALMIVTVSPPPAAVASAHPARADTTKLFRYDEVVISADRYPVSAEKAGAVSTTVERDASWGFGGAAGPLAAVRNLAVTPYGGGMSLRTLSIRGMGSEHTLVLWNGMPAGNMQTGVSDLNLFTAADLSVIQVVPGGASALYGSGAVGGVVNLVPDIPYLPGPALEISAMSGSFAESGLSFRAQARPHPAIGLSVRAGRSRARGDYHFSDPPLSGDAVREDGDYLSRSLTVAAGWTDSGRDRAGLMVSGLMLDQGAPGPLGPGGEASSARRNDTRYIAGLSFEHGPAGSPSVVVTGLIDRQHERFLDASGPYPADDHYQTTWAGVSGQVRFHPARGWILQAGADAHRESAAGSAMDRARGLSSGGVTGSISWTTFNAGGIEASVTPSLRLEGNSGFGPDLSPKIGLNLTREGDGMMARIHATAGSGRRNPTMNDLFYSGEGGKGNPDLSGESSVSFDIGFGGTADLFGGLGWDITWYGIWMRDRIQWLPTVNPRVWSPENIGRTRSTGWEIAGDWNVLPGTAEFRCNYSIIDARRGSLNGDGSIRYDYQLTYVPLDEGSVELRLGGLGTGPRSRSLYLTIALVHTGEKYLLDDESEFLPSSDIVDGTLTVDFSLFGNALTLNYKAGNLTGKDYQVMPGYPMPRFNQRVIVSYNISI